jgi:hypothetical protein
MDDEHDLMEQHFLLSLLMVEILPHLPNKTNEQIFNIYIEEEDFKILHDHPHQPYYDHRHRRHHHHRRLRLDYFFDDFHQIKYQKIRLAESTQKKSLPISIKNKNEHHD